MLAVAVDRLRAIEIRAKQCAGFRVTSWLERERRSARQPGVRRLSAVSADAHGFDFDIRYWRGNPDIFQLMHHKFMVIDEDVAGGAILYNGSANYSARAMSYSFEKRHALRLPAVQAGCRTRFTRGSRRCASQHGQGRADRRRHYAAGLPARHVVVVTFQRCSPSPASLRALPQGSDDVLLRAAAAHRDATRVVILQHRRERDMPIGTARMAKLCLPQASCTSASIGPTAHPSRARFPIRAPARAVVSRTGCEGRLARSAGRAGDARRRRRHVGAGEVGRA